MATCKCGRELTEGICMEEYQSGKPCEDRPIEELTRSIIDTLDTTTAAVIARQKREDAETHCAGCGTTTWETGSCPGVEPK